MWGYGHMMGWGGGWGFLGMFFWLATLVAIIAGVVWLARSWGDRRDPFRRSSALDILEERYARGEINREEYLARKRDITG